MPDTTQRLARTGQVLARLARHRRILTGLDWSHAPPAEPTIAHASGIAEAQAFAADLESPAQHERLFNLSDEVPPGFSRFSSVIEVVGTDEDERRAGRERVKFYKDRGYEVRFFDWSEKS